VRAGVVQGCRAAPGRDRTPDAREPLRPWLVLRRLSVCNIWLIARIANALGASEIEALFASTLLAMASSFFYFSRHLLPYDVAMTFALAAMYVGIRSAHL
jgi:hypothetical protein